MLDAYTVWRTRKITHISISGTKGAGVCMQADRCGDASNMRSTSPVPPLKILIRVLDISSRISVQSWRQQHQPPPSSHGSRRYVFFIKNKLFTTTPKINIVQNKYFEANSFDFLGRKMRGTLPGEARKAWGRGRPDQLLAQWLSKRINGEGERDATPKSAMSAFDKLVASGWMTCQCAPETLARLNRLISKNKTYTRNMHGYETMRNVSLLSSLLCQSAHHLDVLRKLTWLNRFVSEK